ncbi:MAG: PIN domain-containing protein [Thermoplasmata archaeon]
MLLDTNALLLPFRTHLDLAGEVDRAVPGAELGVPVSVLGELDRLAARGVAHALAAGELARSFRRVPTPERGDAAIVSVALAENAVVLTADRRLADRLVAEGVSVLLPRDRTRLELHRGRSPRAAAATVKKRPRLERRQASDARRRPPA